MSLKLGSAHAAPIHSTRSRTPSPSTSMPGRLSGQRAGSSQQSQSPSPSVSLGTALMVVVSTTTSWRYLSTVAGGGSGHAAGANTVVVGGRPHVPPGTRKAWSRLVATILLQTASTFTLAKVTGSHSRSESARPLNDIVW